MRGPNVRQNRENQGRRRAAASVREKAESQRNQGAGSSKTGAQLPGGEAGATAQSRSWCPHGAGLRPRP